MKIELSGIELSDIELNAIAEEVIRLIKDRENKGHWKPNFKYGMYLSEKFWICSVCNEQSMIRKDKCPNCGTKMEVKRG